MNPIEKINKPVDINGKLEGLPNNLNSVNEERLIDMCKNIPEVELNNQCKNLNNILAQELGKKGVDFKQAFLKVKKPFGIS